MASLLCVVSLLLFAISRESAMTHILKTALQQVCIIA